MPTDLYYGGLDGTWDSDGDGIYGEADEDTDVDLMPEVFVGRIPVQTASQAEVATTSMSKQNTSFILILDSFT